jgi:ribosomal protein S18 acetylase RimI-like enzyme
MKVETRPARSGDDDFLSSLFRSTRPELALLPAPLAAQLAADQRRLQEAGYRQSCPQACSLVIEVDRVAAGRLVVDEQPGSTCIVDLAVAPAFRRRGCASAVLRDLQQQAAASGRGVVLSVAHDNAAARRLYLALGFVEEARDAVRASLAWRGR